MFFTSLIFHVFIHIFAFHSAFKSNVQLYFKFTNLDHLSSFNIIAQTFASHNITFDFAKTIADLGLISFQSAYIFISIVSIVLFHIFTYKVVFHAFLPVNVISLFQFVKL
jgi:hypothetical protein